MTKIAINACYGGFSISELALYALAERKGLTIYKDESDQSFPMYYTDPEYQNYFTSRPDNRDDLDLIAVIEELGDKANGMFASLKIIEIPDNVEWEIEEYDGSEWVSEVHRTWS